MNVCCSISVIQIFLCFNDRYRGCEPLRLSCPSCSGTFDCPPVSSLITSSTSVSDPNDVLCKTLLDDVLCKTRLYVIYVLISMWCMCFYIFLWWTLSLNLGMICATYFLIVFFIFILSCRTICRYKFKDCWMICRYMSCNRASIAKSSNGLFVAKKI